MSNENKDARHEARTLNAHHSITVLNELAENYLTMHDGTHLPRIARVCFTTIDNVVKNAARHHQILKLVQDQAREIFALKREILMLKAAKAQGIEPPTKRQPWEMTTEEFKADLKATWKDPFGDECVGFGASKTDTPLCEL